MSTEMMSVNRMLLNACVSIGLCQCVSFACLACEPLNWKTAYSTETDESTLKVGYVIFRGEY